MHHKLRFENLQNLLRFVVLRDLGIHFSFVILSKNSASRDASCDAGTLRDSFAQSETSHGIMPQVIQGPRQYL